MTVIRKAPKLQPSANLAPALSRIAAYVVNRVETETRAAERTARHAEQNAERLQAQMEDLRLNREFGGQPSIHIRKLQNILAQVQKRARDNGIDGLWWYGEVDDEAVIAALTDYTLLSRINENAIRQLENTIHYARDTVEPFTRLADQVKEIRAQLPDLTPHG